MGDESKLTFMELAIEVLRRMGGSTALSAEEIWRSAVDFGLVDRLRSSGKTPANTLGAQLYTIVKKDDSPFTRVGARPAKFMLASSAATATDQELAASAARTPSEPKSRLFRERQLHPLLVWFADKEFGANCRTILHEKSSSGGPKQNEWIHPDIVGVSLFASEWDQAIVDFALSSCAEVVKTYSFELKKVLNFGSLRSDFFQAVSNSSWAHEGYLVAAEIDQDFAFQKELARLSLSFGIGVIQLDLFSLNDSRVIFPARSRDEVDWETAARIAEINPDFRSFATLVTKSVKINSAVLPGFEEVLDDEAAILLAQNLVGHP